MLELLFEFVKCLFVSVVQCIPLALVLVGLCAFFGAIVVVAAIMRCKEKMDRRPRPKEA